ncbi:MAG: AmmeMemoRadiSam system protein A [Desulfobacteraceae bacterium]|jgi:AmmeMemoRadiSam system protein A
MGQGKSHKARRYFNSIACFISFILFLLIWAGIHALGAQEFKTPGSETIARKTSPYEKKGKEGDMVDTDKLTEEEGRCLLSVARQTIQQRLFSSENQGLADSQVSPKFSERRGTFVTLTIDGGLRGCIGHIIPQESLLEGIRINAINAAFQDPRFRPLSRKEWERVKIEISILTEPKSLPYSDAEDLLDKLRPGIDGVIIKKGFHQATFLPQVWEQLPDKKEFLTHLCMKAGLEMDAWKNDKLEVSTYQVQAFEEH